MRSLSWATPAADPKSKSTALAKVSVTATGRVRPLIGNVVHSPRQAQADSTRATMDLHCEHDFSQTQVHAADRATKAAHGLGALAVTTGADLVACGGQYQPESGNGLRTSSHELLTDATVPFGGAALWSAARVRPADLSYARTAVFRSAATPPDALTQRAMIPHFPRDFSQLRVHTDTRATDLAACQHASAYTTVRDVISGPGSPLSHDVRKDMEARLGHDFCDVRVHSDDAADASARSLNANAYTMGSHIVFQRAAFDPSSHDSRKILAHELTHVVQQRNGPVDGTPTVGGVSVSDPSDRFEREAVATAERAMDARIPQRDPDGRQLSADSEREGSIQPQEQTQKTHPITTAKLGRRKHWGDPSPLGGSGKEAHLEGTTGDRSVLAALELHAQPSNQQSIKADDEKPDANSTVQRTIGDGHDLTSPRFAGDPRLEACYDDEARLANGATGESVTKVQQALIESGYDLGPTGADGIYGQRTWDAVKAFKKKEALGWEHMGDVGPGTMRRLDELFPAQSRERQIPTALEPDETNAKCIFEDEVEVAAATERIATGSSSLGFAVPISSLTAVGPVSAGGSTTVITSPPHLSIADTVTRFKNVINVRMPAGTDPNPNLSQAGQFFWTERIEIAVLEELRRLETDPAAAAFATKGEDAVDAIMKRDPGASVLIVECGRLATTTTSTNKSAMLALLRPPPSSGLLIEIGLWNTLNRDPRSNLPNLLAFRSLLTLQTVFSSASTECGFHAFKIVERLKKQGGLKPVTPKGPTVSAHLATGAGTRDLRPGPGGATLRGDVIGQTGVAAAVAQLKLTLDGGRQVHARVLSGVGYGHGALSPTAGAKPVRLGPPPEEHSLVILGFDGDTFVFSDPDAHVSHIPEEGFGELTFDSARSRLSTATDDADFFVTPDGKHARGDKRYQIISLASFR